jgi:hypothetical protein
MNKVAGELPFAPFPDNEDEFLNKLAAINWAGNEEKVVEA